MSKKRIAILGSAGSLKYTCISAFTTAGYDVLLDTYDVDGFIVFDLFPNEIQNIMLENNISVPVFWLTMFPVSNRDPLTTLKDITFEVLNFGMDFDVFFSNLIASVKNKVPL